MRDNTLIPNIPSSKPGTSQSNQRKNIATPNSTNKPMTSIDLLENDMIMLQQQKKSSWEDNMTKPPSALANKRTRDNQIIQTFNQGQIDAYNPIYKQGQASLKSSRPASLGTTKATQFYQYKKSQDEQEAPYSDQAIEQRPSSNNKNSKRITGISFYQNDSPRGLSPTKTKLLENIGKLNLVEYPNKVEGPTPKVWHPRMEDFEQKGSEWQQNIENYKQDDIDKQQEKLKQIKEKTRQTFIAKFNKNLNVDIKQKQSTQQKIYTPGLNSTLISAQQTQSLEPYAHDKQLTSGQINEINKTKDSQQQVIASSNSTIGNFQRYPRLNSAAERSHHASQRNPLQVYENRNAQNPQELKRKRVMSQGEYGIHYDYNIRSIGTKGMFVQEGQNLIIREENRQKTEESNGYSIQNEQQGAKNNKVCRVGNLLRSIQSATVDGRNQSLNINNMTGEVINLNLNNEKLIENINQGLYNNGGNKLIAQQNAITTRSERRPLTAACVDSFKPKSQLASRNSPYRENYLVDFVKQKPVPYNSDTDRKNINSMSRSLQYSLNSNQMALNSTDINVFDELDRFDEKMEENQKMKKIMSRMYHQNKGFCGVTKKENEMLNTVDGFKKVRAKKAQPSYPFCLSFDPF